MQAGPRIPKTRSSGCRDTRFPGRPLLGSEPGVPRIPRDGARARHEEGTSLGGAGGQQGPAFPVVAVPISIL